MTIWEDRRWLKGVFGLLVVYLIVSLGQNILGWRRSIDRINETEQRLKQLAYEELVLNVRLKEVESEDFIESEVRDKLHLAQPGEKVVVLPGKVPEAGLPIPTPTPIVEANWELWFQRFR